MDGLMMKYFVLRPSCKDWHGLASIKAIRTYAKEVEKENPQFAEDLRKWMSDLETENSNQV